MKLKKKDNYIDERRVIRSSRMSMDEIDSLIKIDPAFGRIVCRCSNISEGEIVASLSSPIPPTTIDGVKRRCGAGLGRCQGGFCSTRVHEILSEHYGLDMKEILMDEEGSYIVTSRNKEVCHEE